MTKAQASKRAKIKGSNRTLRDKIVNSIRSGIIDGIYTPGVPLGEVELAKRFKVSRGPVREAIIQLQNEYLVRCFPNRGTFVSQLSEREFDEILQIRSVLEPLAMEYARRNATPKRIKELRRILAAMEQQSNNPEFANTDFQFHQAVWESADRPLLKDTLVQIARPMFVFFQLNWRRYERSGIDCKEVARSHSLMLDYIERKADLSAQACFRPVIEETEQYEKPVLTGSYMS